MISKSDFTGPKISAEIQIVGHAIVSANGMIADANGTIPDALIVDADQKRFQTALDASALIVLGRKGHERHPSRGRRRLVATRSVSGLTPDPNCENAYLWNPQGIGFVSVLDKLDIKSGIVAVTGGQGVFEIFLPHYTKFSLAEVHGLAVESGIPCFADGHPTQVLAKAGLVPGEKISIAEGVSETVWKIS